MPNIIEIASDPNHDPFSLFDINESIVCARDPLLIGIETQAE